MGDEILYSKLEVSDIPKAKDLIKEYVDWIDLDLSFQKIAEELEQFPRAYQEPDNSFFVAKDADKIIACIGMKKIGEGICEMKRLFVKDEYKGKGIGKALVTLILGEAKRKGYKLMRLDTLKKMTKAQNLYRSFGFYEIEKYVENPLEGALFMEKSL